LIGGINSKISPDQLSIINVRVEAQVHCRGAMTLRLDLITEGGDRMHPEPGRLMKILDHFSEVEVWGENKTTRGKILGIFDSEAIQYLKDNQIQLHFCGQPVPLDDRAESLEYKFGLNSDT